MKTAQLADLEVSRIGLGAMTMAGTYTSEGALDDAESIRTIHRALDLGVTHIDTAEVYGPFHSEELVGRAVRGRRDDVVIATKFGLVSHAGGGPGAIDSSPANVRAAVEGSLRRLGTDHIDLYYQHRVDPARPIEDTVGALAELVAEGKVRHIGLSEAGARDHPPRPRRAPGHRAADRVLAVDPRRRGRDPPAAARARHRLRALLPARPRPAHRPDPHRRRLRRRRLAQDQPPLHRRQLRSATSRIVDEVQAIGAEVGATPAQTALAWLLSPGRRHRPDPRHPPGRAGRGEHRRRRRRADRRPARPARRLTPAAGERHDEANMASIDR